MSDGDDWNTKVIDEFRSNGGVVGGYFEGRPLLLLHHEGAKSGKVRVSPLVYATDGDRMIVFATKGGAPAHPDWYHNVRAHPEVEVEVGTERFPVNATVVEGAERDRLWERQKVAIPQFAEYEAKTARTIPVIALARR